VKKAAADVLLEAKAEADRLRGAGTDEGLVLKCLRDFLGDFRV
jgi:hypothetical protein